MMSHRKYNLFLFSLFPSSIFSVETRTRRRFGSYFVAISVCGEATPRVRSRRSRGCSGLIRHSLFQRQQPQVETSAIEVFRLGNIIFVSILVHDAFDGGFRQEARQQIASGKVTRTDGSEIPPNVPRCSLLHSFLNSLFCIGCK